MAPEISAAAASKGVVSSRGTGGRSPKDRSAHDNNFDVLRLSAALLVAVSHSTDIFLGYDVLGKLTNNQSLGGIGLNIFCLISGYLITQSRVNQHALPYTVSRALRIVPALLLALPLMGLVLGPMVTTLGVGEYFSTHQTYYFLLTALVFPLNPSLPGVFGGVALVGQLYSLTAEVAFYILAGFVARRRCYPVVVGLATALVAAVFITHSYDMLPFGTLHDLKWRGVTLAFFPDRLGLTCLYYLFAGSTLAALRVDRLPRRAVVVFSTLLWVVTLTGPTRQVYDTIEMVTLPLIVLLVGSAPHRFLRVPRWLGDISYGVYVYHFFVAEAVFSSVGPRLGPWLGVTAAVLFSCIFGWLSFRLVERPAMAQKARLLCFLRRRRPIVVA